MSDFMAVVPLFCKDLRASLYKPFFIKFYPLFYSPGALFGNFGLVAISLILFTYTQFLLLILFPFSIRRAPSLFFAF